MSFVNRAGIVWGGLMLAFMLTQSGVPADVFIEMWAVATLGPWILLHGLRWMIFGGAN